MVFVRCGPPHRHIQMKAGTYVSAFFFYILHKGG